MKLDKSQAKQQLVAYRPGETDVADPMYVAAVELSMTDPELGRFRDQVVEFDRAFASALNRIEAPADLRTTILASMQANRQAPPVQFSNRWQWLHWVPFAAAAAITLSLAVLFTHWRSEQIGAPASGAPAQAIASGVPLDVFRFAEQFVSNHRPSFRSSDTEQIQQFLVAHGATVPTRLPAKLCWTKSVACDVIDFNGVRVSMVCFTNNGHEMIHLITFHRDAIAAPYPHSLQIRSLERGAFAAWLANDLLHVLYSEAGEENLRTALDI